MIKPSLFPSLYVGHGAPLVALENDDYNQALNKFARNNPTPKTIVVVSAHWETYLPIQITSSLKPELIYDFYGFPQELYEIKYPSPGNPVVAKKIVQLLAIKGFQSVLSPLQGLDHGTWAPLSLAYPEADIPVVQISIPVPRTPKELLKIGEALKPLREEEILLLGSGNIVHNLRMMSFPQKYGKTDEWARMFDEWVKENLETLNINNLNNYREQAPFNNLAVPTTEHFDPLFFILGSADKNEQNKHIYEQFHNHNVSSRCFSFDA